jgi:hypothetical protein
MIAQVDEHQPAVVALAVNPAGQPRLVADIGQPQGGAMVRSVGMHGRGA